MVWAGDQLLWELRARAQPTDDLEAESTSGDFYGVVSYTHATGIDRPLAIHKGGDRVIIPHENWRGQFARGTDLQGRVIDCPEGGAPTPACIRLAWPGHRTTAWHLEARAPDVVTWYGGLVDGMRDASGQMYMRNRYYDPATGQFTQPDPIGLAGGLNAYGFAAGDPVSYSDPYGLKICADKGMQKRIEETYKMEIGWDSDGCIDENSTLTRLRGSRSHAELQDEFIHVVRSGLDIEVTWRDGGGSFFRPPSVFWDDADIGIDWRQAHKPYGIESGGRCALQSPWGVHALIAHEFGHAYNYVRFLDGQAQAPAIRSENLLNRALGRPARSERCHP